MEDAHICEKIDDNVHLFAVFDGHGGKNSIFIKNSKIRT